MLQFNSISLTQFKNYSQHGFRFNSRIVGISGANGVGKTNLLDAIYYLCFTKGYFTRSDAACVSTGLTGFRVEGQLVKNGEAHNVICIFREAGKKEFSVDGDMYDKLAKHIGRFPCVFIAPDDVRVIVEGSEERRRYMDALLSQADAEYLQRLINYNRLLLQRNSYLKTLADTKMRDNGLLDVYDSQLTTDGTYIFSKRKELLVKCILLVRDFYEIIAGGMESIDLSYESQLNNAGFAELLSTSREKDLYTQRTTVGIHKDDMVMTLNMQPFRNIASQGQRKSLLFALKLAEFSILREKKGFSPILLLDDVFEKLDASRMNNLLELVCVKNDGQVFITDTHPERIESHMRELAMEYQRVEIKSEK